MLCYLKNINIIKLVDYLSGDKSYYRKEGNTPAVSILDIFKDDFKLVAFIVPTDIDKGINRDTFVSNLVNNKIFLEKKNSLTPGVFATKEEYEKNVKENSYRLINLVEFNGSYSNYTIKVPGNKIVDPRTLPVQDYYSSRQAQSNSAETYIPEFSPLQLIVDQAIINTKTNKTIELDANVGQLSKPAISNENHISIKLIVVASLLPMVFITQLLNIMKSILVEKEKKQEEGLITIGVHPSTIWLSWEVLYIPIIGIISLFVVTVQRLHFFSNVEYLFAFTIIFLYGLSISGLSIIFTKFFKKVTPAILVSMTLYLLMSIVQQKVYDLSIHYPTIEKIICLLLSPVNANVLFAKMINLNQIEVNISFNNFTQYDIKDYFYVLIGNVIVYHAFIFIIDLFSYTHIHLFRMTGNFTPRHVYAADIEPDPVNAGEPIVQIKDLFKVFYDRTDKWFSRGNKINVLNGLTFNVYDNEIFGILGHNGAGKSTLIKIMTGLMNADHGSIFYHGKNIDRNKRFIRKNVGICLQDSFIFENLTVKENIQLYSQLKNVTTDMAMVLKDIDLVEKQDCIAGELSGGQKRKLCIGLALVGNPKFLFFDEPTTSLDPLSRRKIWDLLLRIRENHVVFLCTHYMDEADILADRKMILNKGDIRCLGSSVFLKNHFHMKYTLNIKTENKKEVDGVIRQNIPEAQYHSQEKEEASYHSWRIPMASTSKFSHLFTELDDLKKRGVIENFSLVSPYLESLFVRLTVETLENSDNDSDSDGIVGMDQKGALEDPASNGEDQQARAVEDRDNDEEDQQARTVENRDKDGETEEDQKELVGKKHSYTLPKLPQVNNFSEKEKLMRFIRYRFKLISRNYTFLFVYFISTIVLLGVTYYSVKDSFNRKLVFNYENTLIDSYSMYHDYYWNYDIKNSNIQKEFTADIAERVFVSPTAQNSTFFNYYTTKEMEEIGKENNGAINPYVSSFSGNLSNNTYHFEIYYNVSMPHALPATINSLDNGILAANHIDEPIKVHSEPFSYTSTLLYTMTESNLVVNACICVALVLSFFGPMVVRERTEKLLKQLHLNGIDNRNYWMGTFIVHFILLFVYLLFILAILIVMGVRCILNLQTFIILMILLCVCCVSSILIQYFISIYLEKNDNSYLCFTLINAISVDSVVTISLLFNVLEDYLSGNGDYGDFAIVLEFLLSLVYPVVSLPITLRNIMHVNTMKEVTGTGVTFASLFKIRNGLLHVWGGDVLGLVLYIILLKRKIRKIQEEHIKSIGTRKPENIEKLETRIREGDDDVLREYEHITQGRLDDPEIPIRMVQVAKEYPAGVHYMSYEEFTAARKNENPRYGEPHVSGYGSGRLIITAVEEVTLGIRREECFGLIGPNGSGKSSLLDMITYSTVQTAGQIYYDGGEENTKIKEDELKMGYCPQSDTLWSELTLVEHLVMYLSLRGQPAEEAHRFAWKLMRFSKIEEHRNKYPHELSGGTRRKLCILLALICYSNKIMLDEPTSGMDPATRHYIWNILKDYIRNEKSSLMITTHSMEEAELLCHRIGILVNGTLKCLGSAKHLKMKFNNTYVLEIQCTAEADTEALDTKIRQELPLLQEEQVKEEMKSKRSIKYTFPITTSEFSGIFKVMEKYKSQGLIQDYSFSQTTLEDTFLTFANLQENKEI